ncbi:MAG: hypothetical protein J6B10_09855 [Lachnospiraceae bacterium]|nr:hypothetical protein [Lachnospiraceae bacterium]
MKIMQKKALCSLLTAVMCLGLFFSTTIEAKADNQITVNIDYLYVKSDGSNGLITKTGSVEPGTLWGDFLYSDEYEEFKPETVIGDSSIPVKQVGIQRCFSDPDSISDYEKEREIKNFNQYLDYAILEYYLYPDDYKEVFLSFEYYEGDEIKDSGTGASLLMPISYTCGEEQSIAYILDNYSIYSYLREYSNISGTTVAVTGTSNRDNDFYTLTFRAPATSSNNNDKKSDSKHKPKQKTEQTVTEPTAETIADPSKAVTYVQATNSLFMNIYQVENSIKAGTVTADTPAKVNLGNYHSLSANTMSKLGQANVDVILTYQYKGKTYTVKIPKGYQFDSDVPWYGPLYMYQLFGQNIQ